MANLTIFTANENLKLSDYSTDTTYTIDTEYIMEDSDEEFIFGRLTGTGLIYNYGLSGGSVTGGASLKSDGSMNWAIDGISITANNSNSLQYAIRHSDCFDSYITDTLLSGNDSIQGSSGNDWLWMSLGQDNIDGGTGADWAIFYSRGGYSSIITVDLSTGNYSTNNTDSRYFFKGTISNVESIRGSHSNSNFIVGNGQSNYLWGGSYSDTLDGGDGNDILRGDGGTDSLTGGAGNDTFLLNQGKYDAKDFINGGDGADAIDYSGFQGNLIINLAIGTAIRYQTSYSEYTDQLTSIENIYGSTWDDSLTGDEFNNVLRGGAGNDTLDGGAGVDTADYATGYTAVTVNLKTSSATGQGIDKILNIENITGSTYGDTLTGNTGANAIKGGGGNDTIDGGAGNDVLDGGAGSDWAYYNAISGTAGITIDLSLTAAQNTVAAGKDTLKAIENLLGSSNADKLTGDANANVLSGAAGADTLAGGLGNDTLIGGAGKDSLTGGAGNDVFKYITTTESAGINRDTITDFVVGTDKIDLSQVDADPLGVTGDQAFTLLAQAKFTGVAGELIFAGGMLSGDVTGDGLADFSIVLTGVTSLSVASLIL